MKIVITGAAGFLGQRLARTLLQRGTLTGPDGRQQDIDCLTLLDMAPPPGPEDDRIRVVTGDIADDRVMRQSIDAGTASIFHLAAIVSGMAEAEFDLGMRVNLDATRALLEICRAHGTCPRVVFTSTAGVFGGELPESVLDATAVNPQSSYGTQKAMAELLINDYSRRGFIDGRALRLPTITVRPGKPNAALSSFASGIIREPLNGQESVCPVDPSTRMWLLSPRALMGCLIRGHELPADAFGPNRVLNLPGLSVTVGEMIAALERVAGADVVRRIRCEEDARVTRIVATWPGRFDTARAHALGFEGDDNFDAIIRQYISDELGHVVM